MSRILPLHVVTAAEWRQSRDAVLDQIGQHFAPSSVIVRSSAADEDSSESSMAGAYRSVPDVPTDSADSLARAINEVLASYRAVNDRSQVLVQPMLGRVAMSGVVTTRDVDTLGPYYVFSYDSSGRTGGVTSGATSGHRTCVHSRSSPFDLADVMLNAVHCAARELERLCDSDRLDIEFAVTPDGGVVILQVRPLAIVPQDAAATDAEIRDCLEDIRSKVREMAGPHPYLQGSRSVFGAMPDWNPAEIIGVRPRRLALTLYKELITDSVWAYQRNNYGYRNLRSFPLMVSLGGMPYIDVRVDFNSFVPADLNDDLAGRLIDYYIDKLVQSPDSHDKVEFDIVFSCYTLDLRERLEALRAHGFSHWDLGELSSSLCRLTNRIIDPLTGLFVADCAKIRQLAARHRTIVESDLAPIGQIYWLIEDCKRYGTLPFAGLARAAFIAVQFLRSFVALGILTAAEYDQYLKSLRTVAKQLADDIAALRRGTLDRTAFLSTYGHLRPGTYDILSQRYDEAFERYFSLESGSTVEDAPQPVEAPFVFTAAQRARIEELIRRHGIGVDAEGLLTFIRLAIEGREHAKFVFSMNLSDALQKIGRLGRELRFTDDDLSYLDISTILRAYASLPVPNLRAVFNSDIELGRTQYRVTRKLKLPPLICEPDTIHSFVVGDGSPNYIGSERIIAETVEGPAITKDSCRGRIVMIERADPGYDWIFAQTLGGLITMYGGTNSHMAIRAAELGIPAVIGCGEQSYTAWRRARVLEIDAANRLVRIMR